MAVAVTARAATLVALVASMLFATAAALPECSAKVCCYNPQAAKDVSNTKATKLCTAPVPPGIPGPSPLIATCFSEAYGVGGFGPCPGASPTPPVLDFGGIGSCFAPDTCYDEGGNPRGPRTLCLLGIGPLTCDLIYRIFPGPTVRVALAAAAARYPAHA